jgi:nitrite reductase/ring-hydroxylating ferredoxin subunit
MSESKIVSVCHLNAVPVGEMRCVSLSDRNVLVAHTNAGVFVADEMCTHEDARLCDGNLNGTLVKCPLHGSRFDLTTGKVLDDPADEDLTIYPTSVSDGVIQIELPKGA